MKYFITEKERKESHSTCYFEFQKGHFKDKVWALDSVFIRDSLWDYYNLNVLFESIEPNFDYYGTTVINFNQWDEILKICETRENSWNCIILDIREWIDECFKSFDCFSIIGM